MTITLNEYRQWVAHHLKLHHLNANFVTGDDVDTWFADLIQPLADRSKIEWLREWSQEQLKIRARQVDGKALGVLSRKVLERMLRPERKPETYACQWCCDRGWIRLHSGGWRPHERADLLVGSEVSDVGRHRLCIACAMSPECRERQERYRALKPHEPRPSLNFHPRFGGYFSLRHADGSLQEVKIDGSETAFPGGIVPDRPAPRGTEVDFANAGGW